MNLENHQVKRFSFYSHSQIRRENESIPGLNCANYFFICFQIQLREQIQLRARLHNIGSFHWKQKRPWACSYWLTVGTKTARVWLSIWSVCFGRNLIFKAFCSFIKFRFAVSSWEKVSKTENIELPIVWGFYLTN